MMKIYYHKIEDFDKKYNIELLHKNKKDKILAYGNKKAKVIKMVEALIIGYVFGYNYKLFYNNYGKPYIKNDASFFNISHSDNIVIMAVSKGEIGVDIERIKENQKNLNLAKKFLTKSEYEFFKNNNDDRLFYKFWTIKESVVKALGVGLSLSLNSFEVLPFCDINKEHIINGKKWYLSQNSFFDYEISICSSKKEDIEWVRIDYKKLNRY